MRALRKVINMRGKAQKKRQEANQAAVRDLEKAIKHKQDEIFYAKERLEELLQEQEWNNSKDDYHSDSVFADELHFAQQKVGMLEKQIEEDRERIKEIKTKTH